MFARIVKHFGFDHDRLLQMPIKRFWFYNKQVDRLAAEEDLRMINLLASVTSGDAYGKAIEGLRRQMGVIHVFAPTENILSVTTEEGLDPQFDRAGLQALKAKFAKAKPVKAD